MKYKWASIDLDHTLLNSKGRITRASFSSIREYQKLGGKIFLCTGRWLISALYFNKKITNSTTYKNDFIISLNGALIYDLKINKIIFKSCIKDDLFKKIITLQDELNLALWVYSMNGIKNKKIFVVNLPIRKIVEKFNYGKIIKFDKNKYNFKDDTLKVLLLSFNHKKIDKAFKILTEKFDDLLTFSRTSKRSIEITNKNCNKGEAIKFIANKYNIDKTNIVAFGDSNNDVPMFKEVGLKIAINPSSKELIELSNFISTGRNAFSYAMKNFVID